MSQETQSLQVQAGGYEVPMIGEPVSVDKLLAMRKLVQNVMERVMVHETHYGTIPGCKQPSLYKAGAEVLAQVFGLRKVSEKEVVMEPDGDVRVNFTVRLLRQRDAVEVGMGFGTCSTGESKYRWKGCWQDEFDQYEDTPDQRRKIKKKKKDGGHYMALQVRQSVADTLNTVLQMAEKRAFVAAVRSVTGCSDMFTQDIEDMDMPPDTDPQADRPAVKEPGPTNGTKPCFKCMQQTPSGAMHGDLCQKCFDDAAKAGGLTQPAEGDAVQSVWKGKIIRTNSAPVTSNDGKSKVTVYYAHGEDKTVFKTTDAKLGGDATAVKVGGKLAKVVFKDVGGSFDIVSISEA